MPHRDPEADLIRLKEEALRLQRRRDTFDAKISARLAANQEQAEAIRTYLKMRALYEGSTPSASKLVALTPDSPFYGKSIAEAGAVLLERYGRPMNEEEIMDGLRAAGVPMVSINPVVNFRMAARRRPDLLFTKSGYWYRAVRDNSRWRLRHQPAASRIGTASCTWPRAWKGSPSQDPGAL